MRNFEFDKDAANTSAANIAGVRPSELPAEELRLDQPEREALRDEALSTFRKADIDDDESDNNTAKIAGAVLIGLLLVGGSIYAYESTVANQAPQQKVAMLPPAPQRNATADQAVTPPVTTPDSNSAPSASSTPAPVSAPKPAHNSPRAGLADATPAAPAPDTSTASADPAINAPMTLTPENAPAPEQAASNNSASSQTAMQQPITAPNVTGSVTQPTPEVANNNANGVMLPSGPTVQPSVQPDLTPASPQTPAPSETSPATPAAPLPTPAQ